MEVSVYPNPVQNHLNIRLTNSNQSYLNLTLYDVSGKMLVKKTINSKKASYYQLEIQR